MTEDEMVKGHEFEQAPGDEGQGSLECYSPWGLKELDTTEQLNNKGYVRNFIKEKFQIICSMYYKELTLLSIHPYVNI